MGEKKLTKADIIDNIRSDIKVTKKNVHEILNVFFQEIKKGLLQDCVIELRGFGTFELKTRKGRKARNPKTGEPVLIKNHGVVIFRPGRELKKKAWPLRH